MKNHIQLETSLVRHAPPLAPPDAARVDAICARVAREPRPVARSHTPAFPLRRLIPVAAAIAVILAAGLLSHRPSALPPPAADLPLPSLASLDKLLDSQLITRSITVEADKLEADLFALASTLNAQVMGIFF